MRLNFTRRGMSLVETVVALALMAVIGGALISFGVTALSLANSAKIRGLGTRLAEQKMEQIKATEQNNKLAIQGGNWTSLTSLAGTEQLPLLTKPNFYQRVTTFIPTGNPVTSYTVAVVVAWLDKGKATNATLTTVISKWQ